VEVLVVHGSANVPKAVRPSDQNRREALSSPEKFASSTPDPRSTVVDEDVAHEKIADEPSVYAVDDNTTMSVRPAVGQIKRTGAFAPNGEPVYIVSSSPIFKVLRARPVHGG